MIVVIRLFAWLKGAELVVECRGLLLETGVFEVGLFRFRLKKKRGDVSRRSHVKENISRFQARLTFLYFVFWCFCDAKIVFFLFIRVFSWRKSGVFLFIAANAGSGTGVLWFKCGVCGI